MSTGWNDHQTECDTIDLKQSKIHVHVDSTSAVVAWAWWLNEHSTRRKAVDNITWKGPNVNDTH